jgi:hypothetical protein
MPQRPPLRPEQCVQRINDYEKHLKGEMKKLKAVRAFLPQSPTPARKPPR